MSKYDIAVVGNGIIGNSICYGLLKEDPTLKIILIGESGHPGGATVAAGAMINCFAELNSFSLKSEAGRAKFDLDIKALRMWPEWISSINRDLADGKDHLHLREGTFVVHNTVSGNLDTRTYKDMVNALDAYAEPYEKVDPVTIPGYNPMDRGRSLEAIYLPNEGFINPHEVLGAFEKIFKASDQIACLNDSVSQVQKKGPVFELKTKQGQTLEADKVILAAGVYTQQLLDQMPEVARRIPRILAGVGNALVIEKNKANPVQHVVRTPNRSGACGLHVMPTLGDHMYVGATNFMYLTPRIYPLTKAIHLLLDCVLEQIDQDLHNSQIIETHVGNRPASLDGYPLIGETSQAGLWVVSGTYRDGFHKSPVIAKHIAKEVLGKAGLIEHNIFAPERPLISCMNRQEAIEEASIHYMAAGYERNMVLPKSGLGPQIQEMIKVKLGTIYDQLETDFGFAPDVLMMFEWTEEHNHEELIRMMKKALAS